MARVCCPIVRGGEGESAGYGELVQRNTQLRCNTKKMRIRYKSSAKKTPTMARVCCTVIRGGEGENAGYEKLMKFVEVESPS
jgi:hypothetical protein